MLKRLTCGLLAGLLLLGAMGGVARATTVLPVAFTELVDTSTEIFIGRVVARRSQWVSTPTGQAIVTRVTFQVDESIKGGLLTETTLEFLGGTVGDTTLKVDGTPEFRVGDRDMVFVGNRNAVSPLIGFWQGRFRVSKDPISGVDTVRGHDGRAVSSTAAVGRAPSSSLKAEPTMTLADFRAEVVGRLRTGAGRQQ